MSCKFKSELLVAAFGQTIHKEFPPCSPGGIPQESSRPVRQFPQGRNAGLQDFFLVLNGRTRYPIMALRSVLTSATPTCTAMWSWCPHQLFPTSQKNWCGVVWVGVPNQIRSHIRTNTYVRDTFVPTPTPHPHQPSYEHVGVASWCGAGKNAPKPLCMLRCKPLVLHVNACWLFD